MTDLSFIVPVKNRQKELVGCLASCLTQTYSNWEAVVVDDHSITDIRRIVDMFEDTRIRYVKQDDGKNGVSQARQKAIQEANGKILVTLDSDDISSPLRADRCSALMQEGGEQLIYTRVCFFNDKTGQTQVKPILTEHNPALLEKFNYITNPGTAFTRKAYEAAGGFYDTDLDIGEDYDLYLRMQEAGVWIRAIDEQHVYYRKGAESATFEAAARISDSVERIRRKHNIARFSWDELLELAPEDLRRALREDQSMKVIWSDRRQEEQKGYMVM